MMALLGCVVLLPLLFVSSDGEAQASQAVLLSVLDAIERLIGFFKSNYNDLNLDGFFGLKVIEGQVQRILEEHEQGRHARLDADVIQRLQVLLQDLRWVGKHAVSAVRADDEGYFNKLGYVITQPWSLFKQPRKVVPTLRWGVSIYESAEKQKLDEEHSDECMMEITKPARGQGHTGQRGRCSLSENCGLLMTRRGLTDYGITHQVLWTALAEKADCGDQMNTLMKTLGFNSTDHMQLEFCTNNFYEMLTFVHIVMQGKVTPDFQDLFMEQQFVCPSLGFFEFLKKDYLDQILSWQLPSGCFGEDLQAEPAVQNPVFQNLPPQADHRPLRPDMLNDLPRLSNLDMKKKEVEQQLKNLQAGNNMLLGSERDGNGDPFAKLQEQLQLLQGSRNVAARKQPKPLERPDRGERVGLARNPGQPLNQQPNGQRRMAENLGKQKLTNVGSVMQQQGHQPPSKKGRPQFADVNRLQDQFPPGFQNPRVNNRQPVRPEGVPGRLQDSLYNKAYKRVPYRLKDLPEDVFPGKIPDYKASRDQGNAPGRQSMVLGNPGNKHPETLRGRRTAEDRYSASLKRQPQVVEVRAQGQGQPFPPAHNLAVKNQPGQRVLVAYETGQGSQRKLLVEKDMPGGCLSHKTGVACGALAMYLRYLLEPALLSSFDTDTHLDFLGEGLAYSKVLRFLRQNLANGKGFMVNAGEEDDDEDMDEKEDNEEMNDEGDEEADREEGEMYPDTKETGRQLERKVVRFGADGDAAVKYPAYKNYNKLGEDRKEAYADEKEDQEEGPDYIKRLEEDDKSANLKNADDTEYTYYEDNDNPAKGDKKHKVQAQPQPSVKHDTHKAREPVLAVNGLAQGRKDSPPAKALIVLLSATSLALIFLMCRFMRKRRIHLKYGSRAFLKH